MRKSPKSQQITVLFSWSLPLHGKAKPYFFPYYSILHIEMQLSQQRNGRKSVILSAHGNICRRNTLILKFSAVKPAVWMDLK